MNNIKKIFIISFIAFICIQNKAFSSVGLGLGGKLVSDLSYVYQTFGHTEFFNELSEMPQFANLALGIGFLEDNLISWGTGFSLAFGASHPILMEFLIGNSPRNDLKTRLSFDWSIMTFTSFLVGKKSLISFFFRNGALITTYYDTKNKDYNVWDNILAYRIPLGFRIFFLERFEIFYEFVPQIGIGWRYFNLMLKGTEATEKDKEEFITLNDDDNVAAGFFYFQAGLNLSLGMHYWFF